MTNLEEATYLGNGYYRLSDGSIKSVDEFDLELDTPKFIEPTALETLSTFPLIKPLTEGWIESSLNIPEAGALGLEILGRKTGLEKLESFGSAYKKFWNEVAEPYHAEGNENFIDSTVRGIGSASASLISSIVSGLGIMKVAKVLSPVSRLLVQLGAVAGSSAIAGLQEATGEHSEILKKGGTIKEADAGALLMASGSAVLNTLPISRFLSPTIRRGAISRLVDGGIEALTEYLEEPLSAAIKLNLAPGYTINDAKNQLENGFKVIIPALLTGTGASIISNQLKIANKSFMKGKVYEDAKNSGVSDLESLRFAREVSEFSPIPSKLIDKKKITPTEITPPDLGIILPPSYEEEETEPDIEEMLRTAGMVKQPEVELAPEYDESFGEFYTRELAETELMNRDKEIEEGLAKGKGVQQVLPEIEPAPSFALTEDTDNIREIVGSLDQLELPFKDNKQQELFKEGVGKTHAQFMSEELSNIEKEDTDKQLTVEIDKYIQSREMQEKGLRRDIVIVLFFLLSFLKI